LPTSDFRHAKNMPFGVGGTCAAGYTFPEFKGKGRLE
jgi:hypothetical protein